MHARDARSLTRNEAEMEELWAIENAIQVACVANKQSIEWVAFTSYLVWDILEKDYGFTVATKGSADTPILISW